MTLQVHEHESRDELLRCSDALIADALVDAGRVDVVAPDSNWALNRKLLLRESTPMGVSVRTHTQLLDALWELHGDGSRLVTADQRAIILRSLASRVGLLEAKPSVELIDMLCGFMAEAIAPGLQPSSALTESQSKVMELVSLYERELELNGLVEEAQVESSLNLSAFEDRAFVFEEPSRDSVHRARFAQRLGASAQVHVLQRTLEGRESRDDGELEALRARLYTAGDGVQATGRVLAGEAIGAHATGSLLASMLQRVVEAGAAYSDITVAFSDTVDAYPAELDALAAAGIPFVTELQLPIARTGLGNAIFDLAGYLHDTQADAAYSALAGFIASPYSGIGADDARALQARWRASGGSTPEQRLADLEHGFTAGQANSNMVAERLAPFGELVQMGWVERIQTMFEHGKAAGLSADALADDAAAADAAMEYFAQCEALHCGWDPDDAGNVKATLRRSFGGACDAVTLCAASSMGLSRTGWCVFADLDAEHYPMAAQPDVFDDLREKLGIAVPDDTAAEQRSLLLSLVESCSQGFAFYRSRHNAAGEECCQSALWDELVAAYRGDQDAGLAVHEVPAALQPYALALSETDAFFSTGTPGDAGSYAVERGVLRDERSVDVLVRAKDGGFREFSPTQLEDYHRCPYLWFTSRRTGYNPMDHSFDQSGLGILFHDAMACFYPMLKEAGHDRVTPENLDFALVIAAEAFDSQLAAATSPQAKPNKALHVRTKADAMEIADLKRKMLDFVERDAHFLPDFVPTYFEVGLAERGTVLEYATVNIRGAVDRIDVDAEGRAVIIDYKLSSLGSDYGLPRDLEADTINTHVQTDIYARLVEKRFAMQGNPLTVVGSVYRSYSTNRLRGVYDASLDWGPVEEAKPGCDALPREGGEGYRAYLDRVESVIAADMRRLAAGDIAPNPTDANVCTYCKGRGFCPKAVN